MTPPGAEYPLSACITAEWSATKSRGRMMAAVFIMQPIGQLVAWAVGMAALQGLSRDYNMEVGVLTTDPDEIDNAKIGIDIFWRIVVGVGAVPALMAIIFRWTIPESGRYTYDVKQDARTALKDTRKVYDQQVAMQSESTELSDLTLEAGMPQTHANNNNNMDFMPQITGTASVPDASFDGFGRSSLGSNDSDMWEIPNPDDDDDDEYNQFSYAELHTYFIKEGNWRLLVGSSLAWLLLDFAFVSLLLHVLASSPSLLTRNISTVSASTTQAQWPSSGPPNVNQIAYRPHPGSSTLLTAMKAQSVKSCEPTPKTPP